MPKRNGNMFPYFRIFNRSIGMYQIMTLFGIFSIGIYSYWSAKSKKYNESEVIITLLIAAIGLFLGSHLLYGLVNYKEMRHLIKSIKNNHSAGQLLSEFNYVFGGSVFYGGLIGGIIAVYIFLYKEKNKLKNYLDIITPGIPLFHFFGRIGCFLSGCCFGKASNFGYTYTHSIIEESNRIKLFPVQLLEALINFTIFFILSHENTYRKYKGKLLLLYLLMYSFSRFLIEFLRGDVYRGIWFHLSTSQWISIIIFVLTSIKIFFDSKYSAMGNIIKSQEEERK
jgi:phosphatidylglycerol:prolipoprotein diacylglycerol transferase